MPEQPRREHARVVDDEKIAGAQEVGQRLDAGVCRRAAGAIDDEQARPAAIGGRLLRDEVGGKVEIEVADVHGRREAALVNAAGGRRKSKVGRLKSEATCDRRLTDGLRLTTG